MVGCGALARQQHIPNIAASARADLHTCCDMSEEALAECAARFHPVRVTRDFREVVADPEVEAVCLATTGKVRLPVIEAAAEAGRAVYVEKPLAGSLEEMREIQTVVTGAGIPFCVGHNRRSAPAMLDAHRIFRGHMADPAPCPWRYEPQGAGRRGMEDEGVAAMSVRINDDWHSWKGWVFDQGHSPCGLMVTEMTHFTDLCNWFLAARCGDGSLIFTAEPDKGHARAIDRFVDEIRGAGPVVCGVEDAVSATRVAFAAVKSAREHRHVAMEEV